MPAACCGTLAHGSRMSDYSVFNEGDDTAAMIYPIIGMPRLGDGLFHQYMQFPYIRCLQKAGASVQLLKPDVSQGAVEAVLEQCAGFLFPGGPDIQPELYGQTAQPGCGKPDRMRDAFELALIKAALAAQKPLFCICRGMQLLNVALGGTLLQDIKAQQEYQHLDFFHRKTATHPIEIDPDSLLARILDTDSAAVNSIHHQAADTVGKGLWVAADSPEGFPEALELEGYSFCLALQWHPEHMTARTPAQQSLFQAFVDACRTFEEV